MFRRLCCDLFLCLLIAHCPGMTPGSAGDWPGWMGPRLDGISEESHWSTNWPDQGLPLQWEQQIGIGFSSVSIAGGRLYSMGHRRGKETVWCLDTNDGEVIWSHSYPAELNPNLYEGGPGATPTVDEDRVYSLSVDGRLICLTAATGQVVWERFLQDDLDVPMHEWGFTGSPFVLGEQLILSAGRVAAWNKHNGELLWRGAPHAAGYGSVRSLQHNGHTLLVSLDCDGLRVTDALNGDEIALAEWKSPFGTNSTTPIVQGHRIFISTGYNVGSALYDLKFADQDLHRGQLIRKWKSRRMRNHFNNSILSNGVLYGFDGNSNLGRVVRLTCLDLETGRVHWKQRGLGCGSLMLAGGRLVILSEDGDLVIAQATPQHYRELARSRFLDGRCWTVPVLLDGKIYGRNASGTLRCVALPETGTE